MANDTASKLKRLWEAIQAFFEERGIGHVDDARRSRLHRFAHFWLLVGKSFIRNRCPVRASALAYTTLLALIPMLAVCVSITTSLLQKEGEKPIRELIDKLVENVAPMLSLQVKSGDAAATDKRAEVVTKITDFIANIQAGTIGFTGSIALVFVAIGLLRTIEATFNDIWGVSHGRGWVASIIQYWATISLGPVVLVLALGLTTGPHFAKTKRILGLSLVTARAIKNPEALAERMVGVVRSEDRVAVYLHEKLMERKDDSVRLAYERYRNVARDDKALRRTLADSLNGLLESESFYNRERFSGVVLRPETQRLADIHPTGHDLAYLNRLLLEDAFPGVIVKKRFEWVGSSVFFILPYVILSLGFALFYQLMPNTRVQPQAALVGGIVGGTLWQLNNKLSVLYLSKAVSYSQIYGSISIIPLFLIGMYFSWLILLFGAQVAYAFQNRQSYLQEKQAEGVNQRGREFVALRMMTLLAQHFQRGENSPGVNLIATTLGVPSRLVSQLVQPLLAAKLIVEVADREIAYTPARPLDQITAHDIIMALRAGQGMELETRADGVRDRVREKFESIYDTERETARSVTLEMLAGCDSPASVLDKVRLA